MAVGFSNTNKPLNPRGQDASPKGFNRASLYSGKALDFDGVNDTLITTYTSGFTGAQEFTYCTYVNADNIALNQHFLYAAEVTGWGLQSLQIRSNGTIRFFAGTGTESTSYVTSETIEANKWYFVVGVHTPTENKIYLNGVLNATAAAANLTAAPTAINIQSAFNGEAANAKVFNTALTAAQVADLYNNPEKVVPTGVADSSLKLYLPMMEGAGTTAYDGSGNGNHGTISGATYTHGIGAPVAQSAVINWNKGSNLFAYSEQFDNSYWTKVAVSLFANNTEAPNGEATAEKALEATSTAYRDFVYRSISVTSGQPYTLSAYVKNGLGRDNAYFFTSDGNKIAKFNIATGAYIGNASGNGYNAWNSYGITDAGNGWYRIHATLNSSAGGNIRFHLGFAENTDDVVAPYAGNNSKGLYAWGMQLENASSVGPYVRTGATAQTSPVLLPQGLTTGRDITGVNLFENVRKQGALNLDGKSWAEVHDNASLDITDAITLEAWVYWDGSSNKGIFGRWHSNASNRNYLFYKNSATTINFYINSSAIASYASLNATKGWTHIVGTYNRTNAVLYIDGVQRAITAHTTAISTGTLPVEIGRNFTTSNQALTAPIAQPRIYNRALTAGEVLQNYNSGKNTYK